MGIHLFHSWRFESHRKENINCKFKKKNIDKIDKNLFRTYFISLYHIALQQIAESLLLPFLCKDSFWDLEGRLVYFELLWDFFFACLWLCKLLVKIIRSFSCKKTEITQLIQTLQSTCPSYLPCCQGFMLQQGWLDWNQLRAYTEQQRQSREYSSWCPCWLSLSFLNTQTTGSWVLSNSHWFAVVKITFNSQLTTNTSLFTAFISSFQQLHYDRAKPCVAV